MLSLDVFDTVLTRACGHPPDLYLWLGRRLQRSGQLSCTPEIFARARYRAELDVWHREGHLDSHVRLPDFYDEVVERLGDAAPPVETLCRAELELEAALLQLVPGASELVGTTEHAGIALRYTTDTYFDDAFIEQQLRRRGLLTPSSRCYVSSTHASSKASGRLYAHIVGAEDVAAADILHAGDHPHSDLEMARRAGLHTRWVPGARLNRYEHLLASHAFDTAGLASALVGAGRLARLGTPADDVDAAAIRDVAAGVAAPVLVGYVLWCLRRAVEEDLQRLVFLARDGQVLSDIARRLVERLGLPIEVHYLLVSRQATNLAGTLTVTSEATAWAFRDVPSLTTTAFLDRLGLTWDDVRPHLEQPPADPPERASDVAGELRSALDAPDIHTRILETAAERRRLLVRYLEDQGLLDGAPTGIVDFGGVGSQVRALHVVFTSCGVPEPTILLMGLDVPPSEMVEGVTQDPPWLRDTSTWLYDHRRRRGIRRARGFGTLVQMFCAADHGSVLGYRRSDDETEVLLTCEKDEAVIGWGLPILRATLESVVEHLVLDADLIDTTADLRSAATELVDVVWRDPTEAEAAAWGAFPFEGAEAASEPRPLAAPYTVRRVVRELRSRTFPNLGWQHWHEGSLRLTAPTLRKLIAAAERFYWASEPEQTGWRSSVVRIMRRLAGRAEGTA